VYADDADLLDQESITITQRQGVAMGTGSLIGMLAGGPIGLIAGGILGQQLAGKSELEEQVVRLQQELATTKQAMTNTGQSLKTVSFEQAHSRARFVHHVMSGLSMDIHFRTDSSSIEPHYRARLNQLCRLMQALPGLQLYLSGHADPRGTDTHNLMLSEQRVERLQQFFVDFGIDANRLHTSAYGEHNNIDNNASAETWPFDRRVNLKMLDATAGKHSNSALPAENATLAAAQSINHNN
jgi:outer membrane protein OmpA-like peptidoglycan-associated protein